MMYLTRDITDAHGYLKAKKDTPVTIYADHGDVFIVTDIDGNRFSCRAEFLTDQSPKKVEREKSTDQLKEQAPVKPAAAKSTKKKSAKKKDIPPAKQLDVFGSA